MAGSINLIPQEERVEQTKTKVVKASTIFTVFLFLVVAGIGGYLYYQAHQLKTQISDYNNEIDLLRSDINNMKEIEVSARNLSKKSSILQSIFSERFYYSKLLTEIAACIPAGVIIDSVSLGRDDTISVTGEAKTYNGVQELADNFFANELFSQVGINSVSLEPRLEVVDFFMVVNYKPEMLHGN